MAIKRPAETTKIGLRNWQLEIDALGRVSHGTVEVAPFTILVGKNNTGKSYVASSLWSLTWLYNLLSLNAKTPYPKWYEEFASSAVRGESGVNIEVDFDRAKSILRHVNQTLKSYGSSHLADVFKLDNFKDTKLKIHPTMLTVGTTVRFRKTTVVSSDKETVSTSIIMEHGNAGSILDLAIEDPQTDAKFYVKYVYCALATLVLFGSRYPTWQAMYIPAARTGLMLAFKALGGGRGPALGIKGERPIILPAPIADFLHRTRTQTLPTGGKGSEIADWLERTILGGKISKQETDDITYQPQGGPALPMYAASSMITELAPFLLILRDEWASQELIFEEPEAHLHLSAQRTIARALVRLKNSGRRIIITTHSDTFLQQINNLITLKSHKHKKAIMEKLGYSEDDLLSIDDVRAFEFVVDENSSEIRPLSPQRTGFAVPDLNETIIALAEETVQLQSDNGG